MIISEPLRTAFARLNAKRVDYLVFGLSAINLYAENEAAVYYTADYDVLLRPTASNLLRACRALEEAGYRLEANREPLGPIDDFMAGRLLERQASVRATKKGELPIDLVPRIPGLDFQKLRRRRRVFDFSGVAVPAIAIKDAVDAKRRAGRPKDKAFLSLYEAAARSTSTKHPRRRRRAAG